MLSLITYFGFESLISNNVTNDVLLSNASVMVSLLGFYFSSMLVALLTIMASLGSISSEIENGTIHSVITKPVSRMQYVIGKYTGLAVLAVAYSAFLYTAIIIINYIVGVPPLDKPDIPVLIKGLALFILEPLAILSLCILGSISFKTLNNGIIIISIYILGTIGSVMEQVGSAIKIDGMIQWGIVISLVSPFDVVYRKMIEVIYSGSNVSLLFSSPLFLSNVIPSNWMILYVCVFLAVMLMLSVRKFNKKDIS
jgi:ABC-type transport system involved in multi-copper enzyme maturation permease subunit